MCECFFMGGFKENWQSVCGGVLWESQYHAVLWTRTAVNCKVFFCLRWNISSAVSCVVSVVKWFPLQLKLPSLFYCLRDDEPKGQSHWCSYVTMETQMQSQKPITLSCKDIPKLQCHNLLSPVPTNTQLIEHSCPQFPPFSPLRVWKPVWMEITANPAAGLWKRLHCCKRNSSVQLTGEEINRINRQRER